MHLGPFTHSSSLTEVRLAWACPRDNQMCMHGGLWDWALSKQESQVREADAPNQLKCP